MKIAILGAAGDVGTRIMSEALARGHHVTGVVRAESQRHKLPAEANYCVADISDPRQLAQVVEGQDLLITLFAHQRGRKRCWCTHGCDSQQRPRRATCAHWWAEPLDC